MALCPAAKPAAGGQHWYICLSAIKLCNYCLVLRLNPYMTNDLITLDLTGMAHGGSAIGRHEGRAIFVPYGIPGEQVQVRIVQDKGRFAIAELVEVLVPSSNRVEPPCPYFGAGQCGGCQFQFIDYANQLTLKHQIVRDQLARIGALPEVIVHPTIPSPMPYGYRSHATFHVAPNKQLGFIKTDHRTVVPVDECLLLSPILSGVFEEAHTQKFTSDARIRLQAGSDNQVIQFTMGSIIDDVTEPLLEKPALRPNQKQNTRKPANTPTTAPESPDKPFGSDVYYQIKERLFRCSAGSFFQVNLVQAEKLVDLVLERLNLSGDEHVLDLYSGVGLFTAFLAAHSAQVAAVEFFAPAVADARHNLSDQTNVEFHMGKIETILPKFKNDYQAAVVDPPRAGMDASALDALINIKPHQIVYVSCDPATLARDAKRLTGAGYILQDVQPVDMFPQTYHIECVAHFVR